MARPGRNYRSSGKGESSRYRPPQKMGDVVAHLMARRGYAQDLTSDAIRQTWQQIAGPLAQFTQPGEIRRGALEVFVQNSTVLQELTFQKQQLLAQLARHEATQTVRDLRFRIGRCQ